MSKSFSRVVPHSGSGGYRTSASIVDHARKYTPRSHGQRVSAKDASERLQQHARYLAMQIAKAERKGRAEKVRKLENELGLTIGRMHAIQSTYLQDALDGREAVYPLEPDKSKPLPGKQYKRWGEE